MSLNSSTGEGASCSRLSRWKTHRDAFGRGAERAGWKAMLTGTAGMIASLGGLSLGLGGNPLLQNMLPEVMVFSGAAFGVSAGGIVASCLGAWLRDDTRSSGNMVAHVRKGGEVRAKAAGFASAVALAAAFALLAGKYVQSATPPASLLSEETEPTKIQKPASPSLSV